MDNQGFGVLQGTKNQFKPLWNLFLEDKITLHQLEESTFSWIIQNEDLYGKKPLPTEPRQYHNTSERDFKEVMKAWYLGCSSRRMENKSNRECVERAKRFFLDVKNNIEEGISLFDRFARDEVPF